MSNHKAQEIFTTIDLEKPYFQLRDVSELTITTELLSLSKLIKMLKDQTTEIIAELKMESSESKDTAKPLLFQF